MGLPLSLINIPKKLNLISFLSLHDYFLISESPTFRGDILYDSIKFSSDGKKDGINIHNILKKSNCYKYNFFKRSIFSFNKIITPSLYVKNLYSELLPKDIILKTIEHGVGLKKRINEINNLVVDDFVNIAFLGVVVGHKGVDVFISLLKDKKLKNKKINWYVIGEIDLSVQNKLNKIKETSKLSILGKYDINNLERILIEHRISLILLLSTVPETYSYTLTEAVQMNIPVIANDIGALGNRIVVGGFGWIYENYKELVDIIVDLVSNKEKIINKSIELTNYSKNMSVKEMALEYAVEYNSLLDKKNIENINKVRSVNKTLLHKLFVQKETNTNQNIIVTGKPTQIENYRTSFLKSILKKNKPVWKLLKTIKSYFNKN